MYLRGHAILGSLCVLGLLAGPGWSAPPFRSHFPATPAAASFAARSSSFAGRSSFAARSSFAFRPTSTFGTTNFALANSALAHNQAAAAGAWRENNHFVRNFEIRNGYYPYGLYNPYVYYPYRHYPYGYYPTYPGYPTTPNTYGSAPDYSSYSTGASPFSYGLINPYATPDSGPTGQPAASYPAPAEAKAPLANPGQPLTAFGIPNDKGAVNWPLAFRLLLPEQKRDMLQKAEAQLQIVSTQAVVGNSNPLLLREASRSVGELRQWLRDHRVNMTEINFRDGEDFLRKLDQALTAMASS